MITRRTLLRNSAGTFAGAMAGTMLARPGYTQPLGTMAEFQDLPTAGNDRLRMLITTAVDAAKSTGAVYADARLTFSQKMSIEGQDLVAGSRRTQYPANRSEIMAFGVRAQVNGYWGFASSPVWTKDEAARLGRAAVDGAKANLSGRPRDVDMAPNPNATSGDWTMPVTDDPFAMDPDEIFDYLCGIKKYMDTLMNEMPFGLPQGMRMGTSFFRQQKAFGSTDGQVVTQRVYRSGGAFSFTVGEAGQPGGGMKAQGELDQFTNAGAGRGFESIRTPHTRDWIHQLYLELEEERKLPVVPVDVGRFPVLLHRGAMAGLLKKSVGIATEIDRIMGFEANSSGTSYIMDPEESLGSLKLGSSVMNVTATRSMPGGIGQVKWDDEGVEPQNIDLVKNGVLTDLQRNREGTGWMKGYLTKTGQPLRSSGGAYALDASAPQMVFPADLILHPDSNRDTTVAQLREQIDKGLEFKTGGAFMDFQQSTGMMNAGTAFLIEKGKRVARVAGAAMLFRTSELWGNLQALGGPSSTLILGTADAKGNNVWNPAFSSVNTPPALFKEMSIINPFQKA